MYPAFLQFGVGYKTSHVAVSVAIVAGSTLFLVLNKNIFMYTTVRSIRSICTRYIHVHTLPSAWLLILVFFLSWFIPNQNITLPVLPFARLITCDVFILFLFFHITKQNRN